MPYAAPTSTTYSSRAEHTSMCHLPVMLNEVMDYLAPADQESILDCTFGGGGYARAILAQAACQLWAIDRDQDAIQRGEQLAKSYPSPSPLHMIAGDFGHMKTLCRQHGLDAFDGIVMDLGVSSFQIDDPMRGFSFKKDGPLDMRMGQDAPSAYDFINTVPEGELADTIYHYGEERHSRRIARAIAHSRREAMIRTTSQLAQIVRSAVPHKGGRPHIDPATRSFQAIRIAVNDELSQLKCGLDDALDLLAPAGRLVVVSFHSLEDRIVKQAFKQRTKTHQGYSRHAPMHVANQNTPAPSYQLLTRKIIRPSAEEADRNPRARSARLRAIVKCAGKRHDLSEGVSS